MRQLSRPLSDYDFLSLFSFAGRTLWKNELDITAVGGPQLEHFYHSKVAFYDASNELLVVFIRVMAMFQPKQELLSRDNFKKTSISTCVALFCDSFNSVSSFPNFANDIVLKYISEG